MKKLSLNIGLSLVCISLWAGCAAKTASVANASKPAAVASWADAPLVKSILTTGLAYPANKASIVNHLDAAGSKLTSMDMGRLKGIPDKTFMSADEVISAANK